MRLFLSPPHLTGSEMALVAEAFASNWITPLGPHVDAFEVEMCARIGGHACALSSGTAALHLALVILGVGPGDDVITSTLTFAASANAITYVGARPVFVDSDIDTWTMDAELLRAELRRRAATGRLPKAVLVVDIYGQCADYEPIQEVCREFEVPLIEDAAEALGATYKGRPAGAFGEMAAFSFNGNKIITSAGGGMLVSSNREHVERARYLATQAREPASHYEHVTVGYNYRLSNILAAVGRGQLAALDDRVQKRRSNYAFYAAALGDLPGLSFMPEAPYGSSNRWLTCLQVDPGSFGATREDVRKHLESLDIESRPVWKPMHAQPVFAACPTVGGAVAERLFENGLCLPSGTAMSRSDLERVACAVRDACVAIR